MCADRFYLATSRRPGLLHRSDMRRRLITLDAMYTQRAAASHVPWSTEATDVTTAATAAPSLDAW